MKKSKLPDQVLIPGYGRANIQTITHITGEDNYSYIHFRASPRPPHCTAYNLAKLQEIFPSFIRSGKSFLVNPAHIDLIRRNPDNPRMFTIVLSTGVRLEVSRRRNVDTLAGVLEEETAPTP